MAAGQTCIQYGSLILTNCRTLAFEQEMVFDESDSDLLYFKTRIRVVGFLHGRSVNTGASPGSSSSSYWNPSTAIFPTPGDGSAGHHHYSIRYLFAPRQNFEMRLGASFNTTNGQMSGGVPVLTAMAFQSSSDWSEATNKDLNNGPKARVFDVTQIAGDTSLRVEVEFEICKLECNANGGCSNTCGVLSNRWSCVDDIDQNFYTTRTFRGKLRTVSSRINANSFRDYVVPPLQPGMRRQAMEFVVSADGLNLEYTIVDREVAFAPPAPATTWKMTHTESITREGELGFYSEVNITLGGDRTCDAKKLISIAAAIAEAKILQALNPKACFLQSISITHETSDDTNLIHLHAKGRRTEKASAVLGVAAARLGRPIEQVDLKNTVANYNRDFSRGARTGEQLEVAGPISLVGAFASYLQQPCSTQHKIFEGNPSDTPTAPSTSEPASLSGTVVSEIPSDDSLGSYSDATVSAMYTFWQMESTYRTVGIKTHLPIARAMSLGGTPLDGPTSVTANLAPAMVQRVIRVTAERVGEEPAIINPSESFVENGVTYSLLSVSNVGGTPTITADNKRLHRAAAELVYALDRQPAIGVALRYGSNPWEQSSGIYTKVLQQVEEGTVA